MEAVYNGTDALGLIAGTNTGDCPPERGLIDTSIASTMEAVLTRRQDLALSAYLPFFFSFRGVTFHAVSRVVCIYTLHTLFYQDDARQTALCDRQRLSTDPFSMHLRQINLICKTSPVAEDP